MRVTNRSGYADREWEYGKREILEILQQQASQQRLISYGELSSKLSSIYIHPHSDAMAEMLGQISIQESNAGRGMLSVIVVRKEDQKPGKGFYDCAASLGKDISDELALWAAESRKVFSTWAK